jgi:hypothetical protein
MPIIRYLKDEAFDPDTILDMSAAFEKACNKLGSTPDMRRLIVRGRSGSAARSVSMLHI